jgi:hypothetical protein
MVPVGNAVVIFALPKTLAPSQKPLFVLITAAGAVKISLAT